MRTPSGPSTLCAPCKHVWPDVPVLLAGLAVSRLAEEIMANINAVDFRSGVILTCRRFNWFFVNERYSMFQSSDFGH